MSVAEGRTARNLRQERTAVVAHALVVVAYPDPASLTHSVARCLEDALGPTTVEVADLAAEGFDPRYTLADRRSYREGAVLPPDVVREQQRLDRASDLVLVFPVYWWSVPALLKGWIDRVFVAGWAFDHSSETGLQPRLQALTTHVVAIAGDDSGAYDRHGYREAMASQLAHGVLDYCGSRRGAFEYLHESESDHEALQPEVDRVVAVVRDSVNRG